MKQSLMILSGGMDSVTMLYDFKWAIGMAVTFTYGANSNPREIQWARYHCRQLGIELVEIDLSFIGRLFNSSLLQGADAIPEGTYSDDNIRSTVVPFRNGIMLSVAAGLAESRGMKRIMIANHAGDHSIYPDCRPEFIRSMAQAIGEGTYVPIEVFAPYTHLTKVEIAERGKKLGIDYSQTYSCYKGGEIHCGKCATCIERRHAIAAAGIDDPTVYQD